MLELESLTVAAGDFWLRDISLTVPASACHAVLGPSGAGKTTLLHAILGIRTPRSGCVRLAGVDITRLPIERRGLGYVLQQIGLFPHLTVRENLAYSARARRRPPAEFQALSDRLIAAAGIGALLDRYPATLSGGERQRVGLARALAGQPRLVLLDEPFAALNASLRRELWWLLRALQSEYGLAVLLVTHDLAEAHFLAGEITVLAAGRILQQGEKAAVYGQPASLEAARFLGVETLQPGCIERQSDGLAVVRVGRARLTAVASAAFADQVLVSIRAEDVMLQHDGGARESARNHLAARVVSVQPGRPLVCVELDVGFPLYAAITCAACDELGIQPGAQVTATIKAPAVHLIPMRD